MPSKRRNWKGTPWVNSLFEKMPRQLMEDARTKAIRHGVSLKTQVVNLLTAWTYAEDNVAFEEEDET